MDSTGEFYQTCKEEIILVLYNLLQRIKAEGMLPNSFHESGIIQIPKQAKQSHEKKTTYKYLS